MQSSSPCSDVINYLAIDPKVSGMLGRPPLRIHQASSLQKWKCLERYHLLLSLLLRYDALVFTRRAQGNLVECITYPDVLASGHVLEFYTVCKLFRWGQIGWMGVRVQLMINCFTFLLTEQLMVVPVMQRWILKNRFLHRTRTWIEDSELRCGGSECFFFYLCSLIICSNIFDEVPNFGHLVITFISLKWHNDGNSVINAYWHLNASHPIWLPIIRQTFFVLGLLTSTSVERDRKTLYLEDISPPPPLRTKALLSQDGLVLDSASLLPLISYMTCDVSMGPACTGTTSMRSARRLKRRSTGCVCRVFQAVVDVKVNADWI